MSIKDNPKLNAPCLNNVISDLEGKIKRLEDEFSAKKFDMGVGFIKAEEFEFHTAWYERLIKEYNEAVTILKQNQKNL